MKLPFTDAPGPAYDVIVVAPSDTVDLAEPARALRANAAGVISVTTMAGNHVNLNFAAGETRAVQVTRVWLTGTTATGIEALV